MKLQNKHTYKITWQQREIKDKTHFISINLIPSKLIYANLYKNTVYLYQKLFLL